MSFKKLSARFQLHSSIPHHERMATTLSGLKLVPLVWKAGVPVTLVDDHKLLHRCAHFALMLISNHERMYCKSSSVRDAGFVHVMM